MSAKRYSPKVPGVSTLAILAAMGFTGVMNPALAGDVCALDNLGDTAGGATSAGARSLACGQNASTVGDSSTAVGFFAVATGIQSTAIGKSATAVGNNSTSLGQDADATGARSTALGNDSTAAISSTAVGHLSSATGVQSTAIGKSATANFNNATALGQSANALGERAAALGNDSTAGVSSTAVGHLANASGVQSTAIGKSATATGNSSTAVGQQASAGSFNNSAAFGYQAVVERANQQVFGTSSNTYTMPGIASDASRAAQSGPLEVLTTDQAGNLASDGGEIFNRLDQNEEGVAVALAVVNPDLTMNERFGLAMNAGFFEGSTAIGATAVGVVWTGTHTRFAIAGGGGVGLDEGTVGGRVGGQLTWK